MYYYNLENYENKMQLIILTSLKINDLIIVLILGSVHASMCVYKDND